MVYHPCFPAISPEQKQLADNRWEQLKEQFETRFITGAVQRAGRSRFMTVTTPTMNSGAISLPYDKLQKREEEIVALMMECLDGDLEDDPLTTYVKDAFGPDSLIDYANSFFL